MHLAAFPADVPSATRLLRSPESIAHVRCAHFYYVLPHVLSPLRYTSASPCRHRGRCMEKQQQQQQPKRWLQLDADVDVESSRDSNGAIGGDRRPVKERSYELGC
ncbi:unnamed protein product [Closterium sp. NIES-54]